MRAWTWVIVVAASVAPAQQATQATTRPAESTVFVAAPKTLTEPFEAAIPGDALPRMLILRGKVAKGGNASFEMNGEVWGTAAGFAAGTESFAAALPIAPSGKDLKAATFRVVPNGSGATLDEVALMPAARVRFVIRDQASKSTIPGEARVESIDGKPPLPQGPFGGFPREGAGWLAADGNGDLYVPYRSTVEFVARATPFRGINRQRHYIDARDQLLVTFLLSADQLPDGATILEGPQRPGIAPAVARDVDRVRGIGRRPKDFRAWPAIDLLMDGPAVVEQALVNPDVKFLATNEADPRLSPAARFVSAELPGGEVLHSNGPVILLVERRRESNAVRAFVKVRLPEGVVADRLVIIAGNQRSEHALSGPSTIPLDVVVPRGTPIALVVTGPPPNPDLPLERAGAFRVFRAP